MAKGKISIYINQLTKFIIYQVIENKTSEEALPTKEKNPAAVALGRLGWLKGGNLELQDNPHSKEKRYQEKPQKRNCLKTRGRLYFI